MLSLLFNTSFWYDLLILVAVVLIVIACIKYPSSKWFVGTVFAIALLISTVYSGIQLNYYYNASGGIFGAITGIFETNVVEVEKMTFSLKNIELIQEHEDTYSAKILSKEVVKLADNQTFMVYVNNEPCSISQLENENDYVIANYSYIFLDENKDILCEDTLSFRFAFYTNSSYLSISTNGGSDAVKYWNYYFNKNVFDIKLEKVDYVYSQEINFTQGDISNYCILTYRVKNEMLKELYTRSSAINSNSYLLDMIENNINENEIFIGFSTTLNEDGIVDLDNYIINSNTTLFAIYKVINLPNGVYETTEADIKVVVENGILASFIVNNQFLNFERNIHGIYFTTKAGEGNNRSYYSLEFNKENETWNCSYVSSAILRDFVLEKCSIYSYDDISIKTLNNEFRGIYLNEEELLWGIHKGGLFYASYTEDDDVISLTFEYITENDTWFVHKLSLLTEIDEEIILTKN